MRVRAGHVNGQRQRVRFVEVPTAELLKLEEDDGRAVQGAYVRLTPKLRRSQREAFDVAAARRALIERGAAAAVVSPVLLPDDVAKSVAASPTRAARDEVRLWFGDELGEEPAAALEGCLRILDEVGL